MKALAILTVIGLTAVAQDAKAANCASPVLSQLLARYALLKRTGDCALVPEVMALSDRDFVWAASNCSNWHRTMSRAQLERTLRAFCRSKPATTVASAQVPCTGDTSNGCRPTPTAPTKGPTSVTIGNAPDQPPSKPWNQPGAPPWTNQPVPKGGSVYDCLDLNQYGCTKWTVLPRNIPSIEPNTGGSVGSRANPSPVGAVRNPSPGAAGSIALPNAGGSSSIPDFDPTPLVQGRYFVPADCPHYGGQSVADDIATFFDVAKGILAYDPNETKKDRCDDEKAAAAQYANAAYVLACLVKRYKPHVPADIPQAMYDTVLNRQAVAQKASDELLDAVDAADRRGECRAGVVSLRTPKQPNEAPPGQQCPYKTPDALKVITDQMTSIADAAGYSELAGDTAVGWANISQEARKHGCDVPDAVACTEAEIKNNYSKPGCRSHPPPLKEKASCDLPENAKSLRCRIQAEMPKADQ